jgi:hypothetical protein
MNQFDLKYSVYEKLDEFKKIISIKSKHHIHVLVDKGLRVYLYLGRIKSSENSR